MGVRTASCISTSALFASGSEVANDNGGEDMVSVRVVKSELTELAEAELQPCFLRNCWGSER
jgi:hypothetical protein